MSRRSQAYAVVKALAMLSAGLAADCAAPLGISALHCTALHCTALHCTALLCQYRIGPTAPLKDSDAIAQLLSSLGRRVRRDVPFPSSHRHAPCAPFPSAMIACGARSTVTVTNCGHSACRLFRSLRMTSCRRRSASSAMRRDSQPQVRTELNDRNSTAARSVGLASNQSHSVR